MKKFKIITAIVLVITSVVACEKILPGTPPGDELLDGPVEGLSFEQNRQFLAGDVAFNDEIFTSQNGLGSIFVATSCGSCHAGDGKGHPFTTLTRFGQVDSTGISFCIWGDRNYKTGHCPVIQRNRYLQVLRFQSSHHLPIPVWGF